MTGSSDCKIDIIPNKKSIVSFFPANKLAQYSKFFSSLIGNTMSEFLNKEDGNISLTNFADKDNVDKLYNSTYQLLANVLYAHAVDYNTEDIKKYALPDGFKAKSDMLSTQEFDNMKTIYQNFEQFKTFHKLNSGFFIDSKSDINEMLTTGDAEDVAVNTEIKEEEQEQTGEKQANYDKVGNEKDQYKEVGSNIKLLFRILTDKKYNPDTESFDVTKDADGYTRLSNPINTFNKISIALNNIKDENVLIAKLKDKQLQKTIPELVQIGKLLGLEKMSDDGIDKRNDGEKILFVSFANQFAKPAVDITTIKSEESGNGNIKVSVVNNLRGTTDKITSQWYNNFVTNNYAIDVTGEPIFMKQDMPTDQPKGFQPSINFLRKLGVELSFDNMPINEKENAKIEVEKSAKFIYGTMNKIFTNNSEYKLTNPIRQLSSTFTVPITIPGAIDEFTRIDNQYSAISKLLNIEAKYTTLSPTTVVLNANGEMQNQITEETNITHTTNTLNTASSIDNLLKTGDFINLKYNPQYKASLLLNKLYDENGVRNNDFSLNLAYMVGANLDGKKSVTRSLTTTDKAKTDVISALINGATSTMLLETSSTFPVISIKDAKGDSVMLFNKENFENIYTQSQNVQEQFLKYLNAELERINSYDIKKEENPSLTKAYGDFGIFSFLNTQNEEFAKSLKSRVEAIEIGSNDANSFFKELEQYLQKEQEEYVKIIKKDGLSKEDLFKAFENKEGDKFNRDKLLRTFLLNNYVQNIEFSILYTGDTVFFDKDAHKRLKFLSSTGLYTNINATANSLVNSNQYRQDYSLRSLINTKSKNKNGEDYKEITDISGGDIINTRTLKDIMSNDIKEFNEFYKKLDNHKITDGQGFATMDFLHEMSIRQGWGNKYTDVTFKYESLFFKKNMLKITLSPNEETLFNTYQSLINTNPELYAIPVMKAGYAGAIVNSTVDGVAYDKFSIAPLTPSFIYGKAKLEKMNMDMINNNVSYVKYASGTKLFKTIPVETDKLGEGKQDQYVKNLFKLQIAYSNESNTVTSIPTQMVKLLYSNLFNNGKEMSPEAKTLYQDYLKTLGYIQKENINSLFSDLGITQQSDGGIKITDGKKFSEKLLQQAILRGLNSNTINALKFNTETNTFNRSPEEAGFYSDLNNLLSGIIDGKLRRFKVAGGDFTLITNGLQSPLKFYKDEKTGTSHCEANVTLTKEFSKLLEKTHPDGNKIETRERLNELLKIPEWVEQNKKSITIVLDRVPTQELNSMDTAIIKEFLPSSMGNAIQLPYEIIVKSGTDFDYDKEKIMTPSFDEKGEIIDHPLKSIEDLQKELENLKQQAKVYAVEATPENILDIVKTIGNIGYEQFKKTQQYKEDLKKLVIAEEQLGNLVNETKTMIDLRNGDETDLIKLIKYTTVGSPNFNFPIFTIQSDFYNQLTSSKEDNAIAENYKKYITQANDLSGLAKNIEGYKTERDKILGGKDFKEFKEYSAKIKDNLNQQRYNFQNLSNRVVDNYSKAILLKGRFAELIKPNTSADLNKVADEIGKINNESVELPTLGDIFKPSQNLDVFAKFHTIKKELGPFAKINTIKQLFTNVGTTISTAVKSGKAMLSLNHNLLTSEQRAKLYDENGRVKIGSIEDVVGDNIQKWISQAINSTVDATKDPKFALLNIDFNNINTDIFMNSILGYPFAKVKYLLNQPGIRYFNQQKQSGLDYKDQILKMFERLDIWKPSAAIYKSIYKGTKEESSINQQLANKQIYDYEFLSQNSKTGEIKVSYKSKQRFVRDDMYSKNKNYIEMRGLLFDIDGKKDLSQYNLYTGDGTKLSDLVDYAPFYSDEALKATMEGKNDISKIENKKDDKYNKLYNAEIRLFSNYFQMSKFAGVFGNLSRYLTFDTTKVSDLIEANNRKVMRQNILDSGLVDDKQLKDLEEHTPLLTFNNGDVIKSVYESFIPYANKFAPTFSNIYNMYANDYETKNKKIQRKLPSTIVNDFMFSIIHNYGNLSKLGTDLITRDDKENIVGKLVEFRNNKLFQELQVTHPILENIVGDIEPSKKQLKNIRFIKTNTNDVVETESLISQFGELLNPNILKEGDVEGTSKKEVEQFNTEFHQFVKDLYNVALAQSGYNKSYFSFREYIPASYYEEDVKRAFKNFNTLDEDQKRTYASQFQIKFVRQNKAYFPAYSNNLFSDRYKDYSFNIAETGFTQIGDTITYRDNNIEKQLDDKLSITDIDYTENIKSITAVSKFKKEYELYYSPDGKLITVVEIDAKTKETKSFTTPDELKRFEFNGVRLGNGIIENNNNINNINNINNMTTIQNTIDTKNKTQLNVKDIGQYVKYQGEVFIVTKINKNNTIQIYNPIKEGTDAKKSVSEKSITAIDNKADIITYREQEYIVTAKNNIVSLKSNKIMNWAEDDGNRKVILALRDNTNDPFKCK